MSVVFQLSFQSPNFLFPVNFFRIFLFRGTWFGFQKYICVTAAAALSKWFVVEGRIEDLRFFSLWELTSICYANYVNKFSFVLSTNMAAMKTTYGVFSHDVTAATLVSQNNETAAMLVSQTNPAGKTFFCSNKFAWLLAT